MAESVIEVENLSKCYRIGAKEESNKTFREVVVDAFLAPIRNLRRLQELTKFEAKPPNGTDGSSAVENSDIIWALKSVSFEVKEGEVLGIIGRNGAGKSTLLKILSRITEPTAGEVRIYGRVSSLLEVGTGFHPELTGRENIYLNAAILGMRKTEIEHKFDEIVAFAEIDKFIDTPVKRYSSGMYVRLAFAVAAHLQSEILLVDEVLAVGDLAFQKKCLGKMGDVAEKGRTILFVSHNMQVLRALCPRSLLIGEGRLVADGPTAETIQKYHATLKATEFGANAYITNPQSRRGSGAARFTEIRVQNISGEETSKFTMGSTIQFALSYQVFSAVRGLFVGIFLRSGVSGEFVTSARHMISEKKLDTGHRGSVVIEWPNVNLRPGEYPLYLQLADSPNRALDVVDDVTLPLTIYTEKGFDDLGFETTRASGFFSIESRITSLKESMRHE